MAARKPIEQLEILKKGVVEIVSEDELLEKLEEGRPLRVKAGFDPTAPDIHLGHTVVINKMRQFQELGHDVIFIVGSFTALIGDPSGSDKVRPRLTVQEVQKNAETYAKQAFKILDKKKTKVIFNHEWLEKLSTQDIFDLASQMTVARMLERDDFEKRYQSHKPIGIHEFLYPLFQAYDSYEIKADVELGGTDQKFNLLVGREIQRAYKQKSQVIMTMPLLEGTDGVQKMSKSLGNYIGITDRSQDMFGKIMSISDELMWKYYELLSSLSHEEIAQQKNDVKDKKVNPKELKVRLASEIVARFYDEKTAKNESEEFDRVFKEKKNPSQIPEIKVKASKEKVGIIFLLTQAKLVSSNSDAKRLIEQGGVRIDAQKVESFHHEVKTSGTILIQVGKRNFAKIVFS